MPTDAELLRRYAADRAEDAFAELVRRHLNLVYFAALRQLGDDPAAAQDVAQSVFIDLARKARVLSQREVLASWLYTSTRFAATKARRARARRHQHEAEAEIMRTLDENPEAAVRWERLRPLIDEVVHELAEPDRAAVLLRFFEQRPFAEVGVALRVSEDAARMRVERALEKLRARLARRGVISTSAALGLMLAGESAAAAPAGLATAVTGSALASLGTMSAPAIGLVQFMSTSKIATGAAALALIAAVSSTSYQIQASTAARAAVVAAQGENDLLLARQRVLQQRDAAAAALLAESQASVDAARAKQAAQRRQAAAVAAEARAAALAQGDAFVARHPEVKQMYIAERRAALAGYYAPLFRMLRLSPGQIERFKDLAMQMDKGASVAGNLGQTIRFSHGGNEEEAKREMRTLLGDEGFGQYLAYVETGPAGLQLVANVAGMLFDSPEPLSAAQNDRLVRILTEGSEMTDWSSRRQFNWSVILPKAREALSSGQLAMLQRYQASDELGQAMDRARMNWAKSAAAPAGK